MNNTNDKRRGDKKYKYLKRLSPIFTVAIVIIGILFWYKYSTRQAIINGVSALETHLKSNDYFMYKPPVERHWGVGTIFRMVEGKPFWVMESAEVLGDVIPVQDRAAISDLVVNGNFAADGVAVIESLLNTELSLNQDLKIQIKFHNPVVIRVSGSKLKKRLEKIEALQKHLRRQSGLHVITEALRVEKIAYILETGERSNVDVSIPKNDAIKLINANFDVEAKNRFSTNYPLYVGYKASKLETIATALGGEGEISLYPLEKDDIDKIYENSFNFSLGSDFDVYGLLIGLGNYYSSKRIGGSLPGAKDSVEIVSRHIKQLPDSVVDELVHDYSPLEGPKITKEDIMGKINEFINKYSQEMNENSLLIFYYFGHGLSEPLSRMALLVPERFRDQPDEEIRHQWGELILVHEIVNKLKVLPGHFLVLIDACRERQRSEELQPMMGLNTLLPPGVGDAVTQLSKTSEVELIPFPNIFPGSNPIIFSSPDRREAYTVAYVLPSGYISRIGPLSKRFDEIWRASLGKGESLTFRKLVQGMIEKRQGDRPVGYPAWVGPMDLPQRDLVKVE
ncbi:hypothetical protein MYX76_12135 [Desulfobacterota bacterium AH_259_B03_O07]|nr:hypothetical protein [Desulfobacterota bacterium AH_259_B03_O07]